MSRFWKIISRRYSVLFRTLLTLCSIGFILLILPKGGRFKFEYDMGKLWMHADLIAPFNFAILKSEAQIKKEQKEVRSSIIPVYRFDPRVQFSTSEAFNKDFDIQYASKESNTQVANIAKLAGNQIITDIYKKGILFLSTVYQKGALDYDIQEVENNVSTYSNTSGLFTPDRAVIYAKAKLSKIAGLRRDLLLALIENHLQANVIIDETLTRSLEREALSNISIARGMVQKGELIVGKDNLVTEQAFLKLESLRKAYLENIDTRSDISIITFGQFLLLSLAIGLMMAFLNIFRPDIFKDNRKLGLLQLVFVFMLAVLSWSIRIKLPSLYYIPYCVVPIIVRLLFDSRVALNIHLLVVLIAGFFVPNGFEFVFLQTTAGMVAIYSIRNLTRRSQFLSSAIMLLLTYFIAFVGISVIHQGNFNSIQLADFLPFVVSTVLSLLAYPLIYGFEKLFAITSDLSLMEITNTNSLLLRDLAFKAPGTFQHSMQVANLAEAAVYKIGGNSLLIRAGALYHDIGKMKNPEYFGENQNKAGFNPHDNLTYEDSARIIIKHVTDGIEMARKNNLPESVVDFIRTHHGNTRVDYFYHSFLKNYPEREMNEKVFRYPGPIPFTKESAVLMLADSVEAASRTLKEPDADSISILVDRIIDYKLDQKQLINSDISLKDITTIRRIFKEMLMGIYHVRVEYKLTELNETQV